MLKSLSSLMLHDSCIIIFGKESLELTTIIEHDVKKLDGTWFESPFADDIEATVIIT